MLGQAGLVKEQVMVQVDDWEEVTLMVPSSTRVKVMLPQGVHPSKYTLM
jgi:hypothetical protein